MLSRLLILLSAIAVLIPLAAHAEDKALERIQKNREINCGVYVLGSIFSYSPEGKPQGFTADLFAEVSKRTDLKVHYTEISSFATLFEDLKTGHYDMVCAPVLLLPSMSMKALPGDFLLEDPINIYADSSKDFSSIKSLDGLNNETYTFVGMDGELGGIYVPQLFPKAKLSMLPMGVAPSNMFLELHSNKADFVVLSHVAELAYSQVSPGKLKQVTDQSLFKASVRLFYPEGSYALKANIDAIVEDMKRDGTLDKLIHKNGLDQ